MTKRNILLLALVMTTTLPLTARAVEPTDVAKDRADATYDARKDMADREYDASKKRCKDLSGNVEDLCLKDAKAAYKAAKADAKAEMEASKARAEAAEERRSAEYSAARAHCEDLPGNAKDACIGEAKLHYHQ